MNQPKSILVQIAFVILIIIGLEILHRLMGKQTIEIQKKRVFFIVVILVIIVDEFIKLFIRMKIYDYPIISVVSFQDRIVYTLKTLYYTFAIPLVNSKIFIIFFSKYFKDKYRLLALSVIGLPLVVVSSYLAVQGIIISNEPLMTYIYISVIMMAYLVCLSYLYMEKYSIVIALLLLNSLFILFF